MTPLIDQPLRNVQAVQIAVIQGSGIRDLDSVNDFNDFNGFNGLNGFNEQSSHLLPFLDLPEQLSGFFFLGKVLIQAQRLAQCVQCLFHIPVFPVGQTEVI